MSAPELASGSPAIAPAIPPFSIATKSSQVACVPIKVLLLNARSKSRGASRCCPYRVMLVRNKSRPTLTLMNIPGLVLPQSCLGVHYSEIPMNLAVRQD